MRVAVVAEYYPRPSHPGLGVWAHRQAVAVQGEGAEVDVLALERPLPPLDALRALSPAGGGPETGQLREWAAGLRNPPRDTTIDGVAVRYVRFVSPPRPLSYADWGRWAARALGRALEELRLERPFDLVHAHYAVPAGDAVMRWMASRSRVPFVVSVHGGDLSYTAARSERGRRTVSRTLAAADAVIANSTLTRSGIERLIGSSERLHVVHPGADPPTGSPQRRSDPTLVTVAHLEPHKSQADVMRAFAALGERHRRLRYLLIGRGPDRSSLEALARELGVADRVEFAGGLSHEQALAQLAGCHVHVMPSRHDAFGVAHLEAMAAGLPSVGAEGTGAEDIARAGEGLMLVPPGDVEAITRALEPLISDPTRRWKLGEAARETVSKNFSWQQNGRKTAAIYASALEK